MRARGGARLLAGLAVLGAARPAAADAALALSPSPDGGVDVRAVGGGASVAVVHVPLATPLLRRGVATAQEVVVDEHRLVEVRVPVRGTSRVEAWVGEIRAGGPRVVWSGLLGARDADGETAVDLDVSTDGVVEYQTAAVVSRCDGAPARLFPRAWDFDAGRFRPIASPLPPPARQTLTARRGDPAMPAGRPLGVFHFTSASTTLAAGADARDLGAPTAVDDGDVSTAWAEGLGGDGRGEWLTARAGAGGIAVVGLRIVPGDAASAAAFRARNRVRRFQLALGPRPDERFDVVLPEDPAQGAARFREPYWVALPRPVVTSCASVILTEIAPGTEAAPAGARGTTAISELSIFTDLDGPDAPERLVAAVARSPDCATRVPALVGLGAPAIDPVAKGIVSSGARGPQRECLVEALARLDPDAGGPASAAAFAAALGGATEKEERLATTALRRAPRAPVDALAGTLDAPAAPVDDRARAARVLGVLDDERAATALLAAAGSGPPELRLEIVRALAAAPRLAAAPTFAAIDGAAGDRARAADLVRVLPALARRSPEAAPRALATLRAAVAPARPFEVRARAIGALAGLGAAGAGDLADVAARADDPVLRHLAARELGALAGDGSTAALRVALGDGDPRVRETAAEGLARRRDAGAASALAAGAKQEPWPFVRRAEVEALAALCAPGAGDLFARALERDVDEVRRVALVGLARCRDGRARDLLLRVVGRRNDAATLRALAAALLGDLGDPTTAAPLAAALDRQLGESEEDLAIESVATATLRALARLGGPEATRAAVKLAADTHHPFRREAVEALGQLCDPVSLSTLHSLEAGSDPLALAAQASLRRCSR